MKVAGKENQFSAIRRYFGEEIEAKIEKRVGEGDLKDFWFDRAIGHPAVYFRFTVNGQTKTEFERL